MKKLDGWDLLAFCSVLAMGAGLWLVYPPAALMLVGVIGLAVSWLGAGVRRR